MIAHVRNRPIVARRYVLSRELSVRTMAVSHLIAPLLEHTIEQIYAEKSR